MPRAGFTTATTGMLLLAGTLAFGLPSKGARGDGNSGPSATLSVDPATESIVVSGGR